MAASLIPIWKNTSFNHVGSNAGLYVDSTGVGADISFENGNGEPIILKQSSYQDSAFNATLPCLPLRLPSKRKARLKNKNIAVYLTNQQNNLLVIEAGSSRSARLTLVEADKESSQLSEIDKRYIHLSTNDVLVTQFQSTRVDDDICCLFQSGDTTLLYTVEENIQNVDLLAEVNTRGTKYASLSPYIFGEFATLTAEGDVNVINIECDPQVVERIAASEDDDPTQVIFGGFIRSTVTLSDQRVVFTDLVSGTAIKICSLDDKRFVDGEQLLMVKNNLCNCLQYFVASTYHLSVWDQRFAIEPVMIWRHQLNDDPTDVSIVRKTQDDGFALVQSRRETSIVDFARSEQNMHVTSRFQPFIAGAPSDFIRFYRDVATDFEGYQEAQKRCESFLSGVAGVCLGDSLVVLQSTQTGDLFYQMFDPKTDSKPEAYNYGLGAHLPSDEVYDFAEKWIRAAGEAAQPKKEHPGTDMVDGFLTMPNASECFACTTSSPAENKSLSGRFCHVSSDEILSVYQCFKECGILKANSEPVDSNIGAEIEDSDLKYGKPLFLNILDKVEAAEKAQELMQSEFAELSLGPSELSRRPVDRLMSSAQLRSGSNKSQVPRSSFVTVGKRKGDSQVEPGTSLALSQELVGTQPISSQDLFETPAASQELFEGLLPQRVAELQEPGMFYDSVLGTTAFQSTPYDESFPGASQSSTICPGSQSQKKKKRPRRSVAGF